MEEDKEFVCFKFNNLTLSQLVFVQAVVMPRLQEVLEEYAHDLAELGGAKC